MRRTSAVGVVIPIHNEEERLEASLSALRTAMTALSASRDHRVALVLDSCTDASATIAHRWAAQNRALVLQCSAANVGIARGAGCAALLQAWHRVSRRRIWLSTTDADSEVPRHWIAAQVEAHDGGVDLWTGRVAVRDWSNGQAGVAARWAERYANEIAPIHGTSMGINAQVYLDIGGFDSLRTGEDRDIYFRALSKGAVPHHDTAVNVVTSARRVARAPLGFAHLLATI